MDFLSEEGEEETLGDAGSTESEESFFIGFSLLEGNSEGRGLLESLGTPSLVFLTYWAN